MPLLRNSLYVSVLQNNGYCVVKRWVLAYKRVGFESQNSVF